MSDTRFTMLGIALIFVGFLLFGIFGQQYYNLSIQEQEFGDCFEFVDGSRIEIECIIATNSKMAFFALVLGLIGAGIFFLVKGARGKWDQDVKPEDAVGPGSSFPS
ncbi:MAG: hypothetical protein ACREAX_04445 [Candidatus Nitrosotenuis sp.]